MTQEKVLQIYDRKKSEYLAAREILAVKKRNVDLLKCQELLEEIEAIILLLTLQQAQQ